MSIVKLNTAAPATGNNTEGGGGLGLFALVAAIGLGIWAVVTFSGKKEEQSQQEEEPAEQETE